MVDENAMAVIMKNNVPKYILVDFKEYEELELARVKRINKIEDVTDLLVDENIEAFKELAK